MIYDLVILCTVLCAGVSFLTWDRNLRMVSAVLVGDEVMSNPIAVTFGVEPLILLEVIVIVIMLIAYAEDEDHEPWRLLTIGCTLGIITVYAALDAEYHGRGWGHMAAGANILDVARLAIVLVAAWPTVGMTLVERIGRGIEGLGYARVSAQRSVHRVSPTQIPDGRY